jgi:putative ABC transport system ATP-binding protein
MAMPNSNSIESADQPVCRLRDARKSYRTETVQTSALNGVDLEVLPGDFLAITGPSGCGKSTLLATLGLIEKLDEGDYQLLGQNIASLGATQRSRMRNQAIGFVFQSFHLVPELSALENVALPLEFAGVPRRLRQQRAAAMLDKVGLQARAGHRPGQLSGGQQQRVAIARALINDPALILADEPTGNLDSENGALVLQLLERLSEEGRTIVMVTHDPQIAGRAQRQIEMQDGKIRQSDSAQR